MIQVPHLTGFAQGEFFFKMWDARTGETLADWHRKQVITLDAGILAASLYKGDAPNCLAVLAVGTGATGNPLSPDAPTATQRRINTEIQRKPFAATQYRDSNGLAVSIRTNVVDFTTTFSESEAVGPLNEMGLMAAPSVLVPNPILNGPTNYDPTIDVTGKDLMVNYLTFNSIGKPSTAILSITWRLSF